MEQTQKTERTNLVKSLDITAPSFMANGTEYFIDDRMTIERFTEYQALSIELGYGRTPAEIYRNLDVMKDHMNKTDFINASVVLMDVMNGVKKVNDRIPTALQLCALFINSATEDITVCDPRVMEKKIEDWKREGLDMTDFFRLATSTMRGFIELYNNLAATISNLTSPSL